MNIPLFILIAAGFLGIIFLWVKLDRRLVERRLRPLEGKLGFRHPPKARDYESSHCLIGKWKSAPVQIHYRSSTRSRPAEISYRAEIPGLLSSRVSFHREKTMEYAAKAIGLTKEPQSGDSLFDREVFIEADDDILAEKLVKIPALRWKIADLIEIPASSVSLDEGGVVLTIRSHWGWKSCWQPEKVEEFLGKIVEIGRILRSVPENQISEDLGSFSPAEGRTFTERVQMLRDPGRLTVLVSALLFFIGPAAFLWGIRYPTVTWDLVWLGFGLGEMAFFIHVPFLFMALRGHSRSHQRFGPMLFGALMGYPTLFIGGLHVANGLFDFKPSYAVPAQVISKYVMPRNHQLRLRLLAVVRNQAEKVEVSPSREFFQQISPGQSCSLILSPGALGEPWVVGVK